METTKITYQEKLERIKTLKTLITEKSKQIDPNISYSLNDLILGNISNCPNQILLNEIFILETKIKNLQESLEG
jgi:hypothetical protein